MTLTVQELSGLVEEIAHRDPKLLPTLLHYLSRREEALACCRAFAAGEEEVAGLRSAHPFAARLIDAPQRSEIQTYRRSSPLDAWIPSLTEDEMKASLKSWFERQGSD